MSKLKVNELDTESGTTISVATTKTLSVPAGATLDVAGTQTVSGTQTVTGTTNLSAATLTLPATLPATALTNATAVPAAQLSGQVPLANLNNAPATDLTTIEDDIALLGFKVAVAGTMAKYNLVDQTEDAFMDATGIDAGNSTNEVRNASNYYSGFSGALDGYTSLYIEDGANNSTTFTDASASPYTLTPAGDTKWSNTQAKFGTTSIYTDNDGDYLTVVSPGANLDMGTGDFTIDMWIRPTGPNQTWDSLIEIGSHNTATGFGIWWNADGMIRTHFGSTTVDSGNDAIATGSWQHIAAVRNGTAYNLYVNGVSKASATNSTSLASSGNGVWLLVQGGNLTRTWGGYTDAFRISKGIARWTSNFTPPTAAPDAGSLDMTLQSNSTTAETTATKGDIVMTYTNGSGTAVLNTDLTAEFSADNGSNWTSMTLVAQGNTGSASPHFIVAAHNVTAGTSGTGMKYRIKTLNQGGSKETRIQAVSLGWS